MKKSVVFVLTFHALLTLLQGQTYVFTTFAGAPSEGSMDGAANAALFLAPGDIASDAAGNLYVADTSNHTLRKITPTGVVTLAGAAGQPGSADGFRTFARFNAPTSLTVDASGNVYVTDDNTVRKITPAGYVSTLAGSPGKSGSDNGLGSAARFRFRPAIYSYGFDPGIATDSSGNVLIADIGNESIRKITPDGTVTTFAGRVGAAGKADGPGDVARFSKPGRMAMDPAGNLVVADYFNGAIRRISPDGVVTTLYQGVWTPRALTVDPAGNIYVAHRWGSPWDYDFAYVPGGHVERISPGGQRMVFAGSALEEGSRDGGGTEARFTTPVGITIDRSGNLYVADAGNNLIRKITAEGIVTTIAGGGPHAVDGTGTAARFRHPTGVAVDRAGNVYVADTGNDRTRKITPTGLVSTFSTGRNVYGSSGPPTYFNYPSYDVAVDPSGVVFVSDQEIHSITPQGLRTTFGRFNAVAIAADPMGTLRVLDRSYRPEFTPGNRIFNLAPNSGVALLAGDDGPAGGADGIGSAASFNAASDVEVDRSGNTYVADSGNHTIRKVTSEGVVTTLAGTAGQRGYADGPVANARLDQPRSLAIDAAGTVFVLEPNRGAIRRIANGFVSTLKTTLTQIDAASRLAADEAGNLYLSDPSNHRILKGVPVLAMESGARFSNLSVRVALRSQQPLVATLDLVGGKPLLVRAIGPGLRPFLPATLLAADPRLDFHDRVGSLLESNDNWGGSTALREAFELTGAFALDPASPDAALIRMTEGYCTLQVSSATGGIGLLEIFDVGPGSLSRISVLRARNWIGDIPDTALVAGFTISGPAQKTVLIRGLGPGLASAPFNVVNPLPGVLLTVSSSDGQALASSEGWATALTGAFARVDAAPLATGSNDAALLLTLPPGVYSILFQGANGSAGEGMLELYDFD